MKELEEVIRVENSHPALVDKNTFDRIQELLEIRSPTITKPRSVNSGYLLSGIIYCGKCGSTMQGCAAKSSQFFYYGCNNYLRRGKDVCDAGLVSKKKLESFIIDRIKANILTDNNLEELVSLTIKNLQVPKTISGKENAGPGRPFPGHRG